MRTALELAVLGSVAAGGIGGIVYILSKSRRDPRERERRRRRAVSARGRMGDGHVTDVSPAALYYSYSVRGVDYAASQDIAELLPQLPEDLESLIGPATIRFLPENPGNSIVVSEDWFGARGRQRRRLPKGA